MKNWKKNIFFTIKTIIIFALNYQIAFAENTDKDYEERYRLSKELHKVIDSEKTIDQGIRKSFEEEIEKNEIDLDNRMPPYEKMRKFMENTLSKYPIVKEINENLIEASAKIYSKKELEVLVEFYKMGLDNKKAEGKDIGEECTERVITKYAKELEEEYNRIFKQ